MVLFSIKLWNTQTTAILTKQNKSIFNQIGTYDTFKIFNLKTKHLLMLKTYLC